MRAGLRHAPGITDGDAQFAAYDSFDGSEIPGPLAPLHRSVQDAATVGRDLVALSVPRFETISE
jgi:hypothetical protein